MLKANQLYISEKKFNPYSIKMDCLGHIIDDKGLHADSDKMEKIWNWSSPGIRQRSFNFWD